MGKNNVNTLGKAMFQAAGPFLAAIYLLLYGIYGRITLVSILSLFVFVLMITRIVTQYRTMHKERESDIAFAVFLDAISDAGIQYWPLLAALFIRPNMEFVSDIIVFCVLLLVLLINSAKIFKEEWLGHNHKQINSPSL